MTSIHSGRLKPAQRYLEPLRVYGNELSGIGLYRVGDGDAAGDSGAASGLGQEVEVEVARIVSWFCEPIQIGQASFLLCSPIAGAKIDVSAKLNALSPVEHAIQPLGLCVRFLR